MDPLLLPIEHPHKTPPLTILRGGGVSGPPVPPPSGSAHGPGCKGPQLHRTRGDTSWFVSQSFGYKKCYNFAICSYLVVKNAKYWLSSIAYFTFFKKIKLSYKFSDVARRRKVGAPPPPEKKGHKRSQRHKSAR